MKTKSIIGTNLKTKKVNSNKIIRKITDKIKGKMFSSRWRWNSSYMLDFKAQL